MIKVNEIAFIAYPARDKQKARDFYEGILGLTPTLNLDMPEGFWVEYELGDNALALSNFWRPSGIATQAGPTVGLEVDDYDDAIADLKSKSVPFLLETIDNPGCRMAVIQDPDGNSLFVHKRKSVLHLKNPSTPPPSSL